MLGLLVVAFFFVVLCALLIAAGVQAITDTDAFRTACDVLGYATTHLWTIAIWVPILAVAAAMKVVGCDRVFARIFTSILWSTIRILRVIVGLFRARVGVDRGDLVDQGSSADRGR